MSIELSGEYHDDVGRLMAEVERLQGIQPEIPPFPPYGYGLPRFGLRWNGPSNPLAVPMGDGYWTPWHLAEQLRADADRYRWMKANVRNGSFGTDTGWIDDDTEHWDDDLDLKMGITTLK